MKICASQRLSYQMMDESDAELLFQLDQDLEVMRFINGGQRTSRKDINEIFIPRLNSYINSKQGWGLWKVLLTDNQEFIGWILIRPLAFFSDKPEFDNIEIGWRFFKHVWGKGYATEAATSICEQISAASQSGDINKISRITAIAVAENLASISVMKKLGLSFLKTAIHQDPLGNQEAVYYQKEIQTN